MSIIRKTDDPDGKVRLYDCDTLRPTAYPTRTDTLTWMRRSPRHSDAHAVRAVPRPPPDALRTQRPDRYPKGGKASITVTIINFTEKVIMAQRG